MALDTALVCAACSSMSSKSFMGDVAAHVFLLLLQSYDTIPNEPATVNSTDAWLGMVALLPSPPTVTRLPLDAATAEMDSLAE